jgi:AraC-like DNA-binding protein
MIEAAARLLDGESVTNAALYAGYSGTSAFINAFKARCGETPGAFRSGGDAGAIKARVAALP